ncbi:hypothetical protein G7N23_18720 [Escherichia coli]|nr:hypothetical protein [Escherichia coli]
MFAGKKSAQIREILINESAWEDMTCLFAPSLGIVPTELYNLHRDFLKLKEIKLEQPLPAVKLYISYNKASLNNLVFSRFIDRLNDSF